MPLTRATIRQYEAFLAIADLHSISAAADRLGLTSSAVSQLLAEMETDLGFPPVRSHHSACQPFERWTRLPSFSRNDTALRTGRRTICRRYPQSRGRHCTGRCATGAREHRLACCNRAVCFAQAESGDSDLRHCSRATRGASGQWRHRSRDWPGPPCRQQGQLRTLVRERLGHVERARPSTCFATTGALARSARRTDCGDRTGP